MTTTIGSKGTQLDLLIRQGATFGPYLITLTNPDNTGVDLTGSTIRAQIRKTPNSILSEAVSPIITYTDRLNGIFAIEFTDEATATLSAGAKETDPESLYVWDLEMEDATGRVIPLLYGDVRVFREVTKAV